MQRLLAALIVFSTATICFGSGAAQRAASTQRAVLDRYCVTCHTQRQKERGAVPIALDNADLSNVGSQAELWEKVVRKVRACRRPA